MSATAPRDPRAHARRLASKGAKLGEIKGALITAALDDGVPLAQAKDDAQAVVDKIREEVPHRHWNWRATVRERFADVSTGAVELSSSWEQHMLCKAIDVYLAEDDAAYLAKPGLRAA